MPNLITGLKYHIPKEKLETEEQLLAIFSDLREIYKKFTGNFEITRKDGMPVASFLNFLEIAINEKSPSVILTGSGDIGGLSVENASLEYDLSDVFDKTRFWDIYRDGSCFSCHNSYSVSIAQDEVEGRCKVKEHMYSKNCSEYKPKRTNSEGKAARRLEKLIIEASNF